MKKLIFLLLLISINAMADVLFIDLNNVEMEIDVARKAAKLRGENLIVLPLNRDKYKNPAKSKLDAQYAAVAGRMERACYRDEQPTGSAPACQAVIREMNAIEEKIQKLPVMPTYDAKKLQEEMATVKEKINSVMISGHDGDGDFAGEFGHIGGRGFLDALSKFHGRDDVKSLYLLGCNSATSHTLADLWKKALPKAHFIAGYEGIGYLRDNGLGHSFIKNVMAEEQKIIASATMADALKRFRGLFGNDKTHNTAASVVLNCDSANPIYLSSINPAKPFLELFNCDKDFTKKLNTFLECALSETAPCEVVGSQAKDLIYQMQKPAVCNMGLTADLTQTDKIKNQLYFLNAFADRYSYFSPFQIFSRLPEEVRKQLGIVPEELKTLPAIKQKLLAVKKFYENKFNYKDIKDMSLFTLKENATNKVYFDQMWIAASNLDLSVMRQNPPGAGTIRAQAFFKAMSAGENVGTYKDRIEQLEKEKTELITITTDRSRHYEINLFYSQEINALKQYQHENSK